MKAGQRAGEAAAFVTTQWTRVLAASGDSEEARKTLSELCEAYYDPVFRFIRHQPSAGEDPRDLTHEFFARLLERRGLEGADPARGRFRSYLLGAVKHFLSDERIRAKRLKRGGGAIHEPIRPATDSTPGLDIPDTTAFPPEAWFDRLWALTVLDRALKQLADEMRGLDKARDFEVLKPWLTGECEDLSQVGAAEELGLSEGAVKVAIHRLRKRFRTLVKQEIGETLDSPDQLDNELRCLLEAISSAS